jgi:cyclopropane fatty-acyl-phospholipid synthase-like methyltransferase
VTDAPRPGADSYAPRTHYDRVTAAWTLLLGEELHYGVFGRGDEELPSATAELTRLMAEAAAPLDGVEVLDVGCGTGAQACRLAAEHGARVTGITTSAVGVEAARARAAATGVDDRARFEQRDGMDNGFPDASFDRAWVLESSHLMRRRDRLVAECARVLRPGGRMALCDIVLSREMPFDEVRRLREPLALLREVFGDARMEQLSTYAELAAANGLAVDRELDLTAATRPTFDRWRANADRHRDEVAASIGADGLQRFLDATDVMERFWDEGRLGYGLLAAAKPA